MGRKIEIRINDVMYDGDTSPARDQLEMLTIASQNMMLPVLAKGVSDMALVAAFSSLNISTIERLKDLVIKKGEFRRSADGVPVAENIFQDEVHLFLLLMGRALEENIGPFWKLNKGGRDEEETTSENQT
ncbi:phage tail assembly chaperone [Klebsiella oxytoca]